MGQSVAERQRAFRERQRELGRTQSLGVLVTPDEAFFMARVLEAMRKTGAYPAALRDPKTGRYIHLDV